MKPSTQKAVRTLLQDDEFLNQLAENYERLVAHGLARVPAMKQALRKAGGLE